MTKATVAVRHPRMDVTKDRRDMCSHRSTDITVKISIVTHIKYVALASAIVPNVLYSRGLSIGALSFTLVNKMVTAYTGRSDEPRTEICKC